MKLNKYTPGYQSWLTAEGCKTLESGYLLDGETQNCMFHRVASAAAKYISGTVYSDHAYEVFYHILSRGWLGLSTPVAANLGTDRGLPISCLTGDSWINTKVEGGKQIKDIEVGDEVLTHKGRHRKVVAKSSRESNGDLFELKVSSRKTAIKITGNHPVLTNLGWVRVDDLDPNIHLIATNNSLTYKPEIKPINISKYKEEALNRIKNNSGMYSSSNIPSEINISLELAWALGLWFAEGSLSTNKGRPNGIRITMGTHEFNTINSWFEVIKSAFGLNGIIYESNVIRNGKNNSWLSCNINSVVLGSFFASEFGTNCKTKNIPVWIKNLPIEYLKEFFRGVYDGDGYKTTDIHYLTLSNPKLLLSLYEIALKCNYRVALNMTAKAGKFATTRYVYRLGIFCNQGSKLNKHSIASGVEFKDGLRYCPFYLSKLDQDEEVFDIQVYEDESFSVCGVVVHNCYLSSIENSVAGIGDGLKEAMLLGKYGGGLGHDFSKINGVTPAHSWAKMYDMAASNVKQGGNLSKKNGEKVVRKGSMAAYLRIDHPDIIDFLNAKELLKGDQREKIDSNIAVTIPNSFLEKIWSYLFDNKIEYQKEWDIWVKVLELGMSYGSPYLLFLDNVQDADPIWYKEKGYKTTQSNLCSEIMLHTDEKITAVCCLSSLNLALFDDWANVDIYGYSVPFWSTLFLDCVMSEFLSKTENKEGFEKAYFGAWLHRPLGLGVIGYHTYLQQNLVPFESDKARKINKRIFKYINEESKYATKCMAKELGEPEELKGYGIRNSHRCALAPTTSNSILAGGVSQGIEPVASNYYMFTGSKGMFIRQNRVLKSFLKNLNKDTDDIWKSISEHDGSVQHLDIPQIYKDVFKTAMEINQEEIIRQSAYRQKYICQGQSLNLFINPNEDPKKIHYWHLLAWKLGVKGRYYIRSTNIKAQKGNQTDQQNPTQTHYHLLTRPNCIYCSKAKQLLESLGFPYTEELKPEGLVPEIYFNNEFIGGFNELNKLLTNEVVDNGECLACEG